MPECVFYVDGNPDNNDTRSGNFGLGIVRQWPEVIGVAVQSPLTYVPQYRFAEVDLVDVPQGPADDGSPQISELSLLTLHQQAPPGYTMFDIVQDSPWMALVPKSISINGIPTTWPGKLEHPIAMIDTGGTQPYLSDPNGDVCQAEWPNPGSMPPWIDSESISCIATKSPIEITVGDATNSWSYTIDLSSLPDVDQTTSLVMCQTCKYMYGANGMNIGGLSMLFNSLMVDYAGYQVGFKPKTAAQV